MSRDQSQVLERSPSASPTDAHSEYYDDPPPLLDSRLPADQVRGVVRLVQCSRCCRPLRDAVTLPCGRSICRPCLPETQARADISYPATASRIQGFQCPFTDCGKRHALGDCGVDVVLNKAVEHFRVAIEDQRRSTTLFTHVVARDEWEVAGVGSLKEIQSTSRIVPGGKLVAVYTLAEMGELGYDTEVSFPEASPCEENIAAADETVFSRLKSLVRTDMDCQVCYALFYDPLTTVCGHTFCRNCLHRVLDHSLYCPICRRGLSISPLLYRQSCPSNVSLNKIINTFWADMVLARRDAQAAENLSRDREYDVPIFVCALSFPLMPTFLHVFEPRYRLMIRRVLEGDRTFGMVLPQRPRTPDEPHFMEHGTLLRIVNAEYFADGRSLIETMGISRFQITRHGVLDGYLVGKILRVDDISMSEEEELEANERRGAVPVTPELASGTENEPQATQTPAQPQTPSVAQLMTAEDLQRLPTSELLAYNIAFVERMRRQSVPWLAQRIIAIYGECPTDAAKFPWWFASILPAKEVEKYKLLATTSVRERLKVCCLWVVEWESSRWVQIIDGGPGLSQTVESSD